MPGKVDGTEDVCARFFCGHAHAREVCTAGGKVSLEGFVDALVIVEGLKKAGKELTPRG